MEPAELIRRAEARCQEAFRRMEEIEYHNTEKVLDVMRRHAVSPRHFAPTTGYGYDDVGRDTLEALYADLFHTEAAIVRPQIVSGTHTLSLAMFGVLRPGDELLYASGAPYDSLEEVIGLRGDGACSLKEMNVSYAQVEMKDGKLDLAAIRTAMKPNTRMVAVQRSRGYSTRPSLMPEDVEPLARMLHEEFPNACLMVDNCYGEFVCEKEPSEYGADLCVPHQKPRRRAGSHRRLYRGPGRPDPPNFLSPDGPWHRPGGGQLRRQLPSLLSGPVHGPSYGGAGGQDLYSGGGGV